MLPPDFVEYLLDAAETDKTFLHVLVYDGALPSPC